MNGRITIKLNSSIHDGEALKSTGTMKISVSEDTTVTIGDGCMFSAGVYIRSDDSHPLFSKVTGKLVNLSRSETIGDDVW